MRVSTAVTGVVMLAAGVAVGLWLAPGGETEPKAEPAVPQTSHRQLADEGEKASVMALRAKIRDLERQLAEKSAEAVAVPTNAPGPGGMFPGVGPDGRRESFLARLERMKTEEPARYAQITNNMARWRRQRAEQQMERMEFLSSVDTSRMGKAAKGVHESLQKYVTLREEIEQQLHNENLDEDQRRSLMEQMHEANRQVWALNGVERENLIEATAQSLGFEGQDVKDIAATMQEIIKATDNGFGGPPGHHGRGGGGGPPPPR